MLKACKRFLFKIGPSKRFRSKMESGELWRRSSGTRAASRLAGNVSIVFVCACSRLSECVRAAQLTLRPLASRHWRRWWQKKG